jgi:hypothetical protein
MGAFPARIFFFRVSTEARYVFNPFSHSSVSERQEQLQQARFYLVNRFWGLFTGT